MIKQDFSAELIHVFQHELEEFKLCSLEWDRAMEDAELEYPLDNRFIIHHHDKMMKHLEALLTLLELVPISFHEEGV